MNRLLLLSALCITVLMSSCVPYENIVYMQNKGTATDSTQMLNEVQKPYRVQINDILNIRIRVLDQENEEIFNPVSEANLNASSQERAYFDGFTVDLHGQIRVPNLGKLAVLGYTTEEIEQMIEKELLETSFKETANIFVTVKLAGLRYTVNGEINNPGTQVVFQERLNIYEAIANSGEIPLTGDVTDVQIIRQYPQGQEIHHLDLTDVAVMQSPYYYVQPNDIIYVKPLKQKTWGTGTTGRETFTTIVTVVSFLTTLTLLFTRI